jgi:hypothetical protein
MMRAAWWISMVLLFGCAHSAAGQGTTSLPSTKVSFGVGATLAGGHAIGDVTAELRGNAAGAPPPFRLLRAESRIDGAAAIDGRVSVALTPAFAVEVGGTYASPQLVVAISEDAEAGEPVSAIEQLSQYAVEVSGILQLARSGWGSRARPYAIAGAGYLRQLHEGRLRLETGGTIHAGGGVQYWLRGGPNQRGRRPVGVRFEARVVFRNGGIDFEDQARAYPALSALAFFGF